MPTQVPYAAHCGAPGVMDNANWSALHLPACELQSQANITVFAVHEEALVEPPNSAKARRRKTMQAPLTQSADSTESATPEAQAPESAARHERPATRASKASERSPDAFHQGNLVRTHQPN